MSEPTLVEYRVRPRTLHAVTRYTEHEDGTSQSVEIGVFSNPNGAYDVAYSMARQHREDLVWPPADERMRFPERPEGYDNAVPGRVE